MKHTSFLKKCVTFLMMITLFLGSNILEVFASGAPSTIVTGNSYYLNGYVAGVGFDVKTIQGGGYAYCINYYKNTPKNVKMYLAGEKDAGFAYIMKNGYPNVSITGNKNYDYYITQTAVWWYLDETTNSNNLPNSFKTNGSDPYGLRTYIKKLVNGAIAAKKQGYVTPKLGLSNSQPSLTITSDKKYFESGNIQVTGVAVSSNVNITISGAPSNTVLVHSTTGKSQNTYKIGESFKVRVPVSSVKNLSNTITIQATATGSVDKAYEYRANNSSLQEVIPFTLYTVTTSLSASTKVTLNTSKVSIIKIDQNTQKPLAGTTLVLKDSEGKVITSWTSTTNAHTIQNLQDGTYTIEETKAAKGYQKMTKSVKFTISQSNRNVTVYVSNQKIFKSVEIEKIDAATKKPLAGAKLRITDQSGKVIKEFVTTTQKYVLQNIADGTYYVEEIEAPVGYIKSTKKYSFTISDSNPTATLTISNTQKKKVTKSVQIQKIDEVTKQALAGAKLRITDKSGKVIAEFITTEEAYLMEDLEDGTYYVEEIEAPSGYTKSNEKYEFTISDKTPTAVIIFTNKEVEIIQEVPDTGSHSHMELMIIGSLLMIGSIGLVLYQGKKRYE